MAALAEVFAKQLSPALIEIYWDALHHIPIEQFQQGAKSWIRHCKHFPKPADILDRFREMEQAKPKPIDLQLPDLEPKWLRFTNALFLQYLTRRRGEDEFRGDINLRARRSACHELAEFFAGIEAEHDPSATEAELTTRFESIMASIPDLSNDDAWLPIELARQKLEDVERDKRQARG